MDSLVEQLEQLTQQGVLCHDESCQCDRCVEATAEAYLATLHQLKHYDEAPTRPW